MAEPEPPSTSDLILLITGVKKLRSPDASAQTGSDYYLEQSSSPEKPSLRPTLLNLGWHVSPKAAWDKVRHRDWLIATLFQNIADHKHDFVAIAGNTLASIDLLTKDYKPRMAGATKAFNDALTTKAGLERNYFSTLTFGISKERDNNRDVFVFGAGMRRRASLWLSHDEALQADVEFFMPFYVLPSSQHSETEIFPTARSLNAGISVRKSNGTALAMEGTNELVAMRFNLRFPFYTQWLSKTKEAPEDFHTIFETPEINIQKRVKEPNKPVGSWEKFAGWKEFLGNYCERAEVGDLLNSPIGPLLIEKISDNSGVKDIILKQSKRDEIKTDLANVKKDLDDTLSLLQNIWTWKEKEEEEKEGEGPHPSNRKLGSLLEALGFMSSKAGSGGDFEYSFKLAAGLTPWTVLDSVLNELDGFPLFVSGLKSQKDKDARIAISLASQTNPVDRKKHYFGLAGLAYNIPLTPVPENAGEDKEKSKGDELKTPTITLSDDNFTEDESILIEEDEQEEDEGKEEPVDVPDKKVESKVEVLLHLGKWFSNETLDDNWLLRLLPKADTGGKQRVPLPGIRLLPFKRVEDRKPEDTIFAWTLLLDLLSLGVDIKGTTKEGLGFVEGIAGHFGLGAVEVRLAIKISLEDLTTEKTFWDRAAFGVGVKLKDLRLSLGAKEEEKKDKGAGDEIMAGLQELLADEWVVVPTPKKPEQKKVKTRLSAKKKDKFSISVGYLTPLKQGSHGTLDIQLYDEKGNRGKMALIPIDRNYGPFYLRQIGIGLKGVENVELSKGLPDSAQLTVSATGGLRFPVFELGLIGAKLIFPLAKPIDYQFALDGLDVSVKIGSVVISGSFFKSGIEYAGSLTVDLPKASFSAMGFYGSLRVFSMARDKEIFNSLKLGNVNPKLLAKLKENSITPAPIRPIRPGYGPDEWELQTADNKRFTITDEDDKLNVLRSDKTFFVYAMLNAASGCGPTFGPIQFTGIALGYGYNRRLKVPGIEGVAEFPMVQLVMGEGGYQEEDTSLEVRTQLGKPLEDPVAMLAKMKDHVLAEKDQQFICGGARFTISGIVDCFALIIVQWGKELEISLLGLARFRHTRDLTAKPICYVEMQVLMTIKPKDGLFKLQALLTSNSWIINENCKLTGGFALFVWFDGDHKGDLVITFGGYHPRFRRPEHYPIVPRLGLNWAVNDNLTIKGGVYLAITPSCGMLGAKLEATFHSGRISAYFVAYLDVIINWSPLYFEAELGISLRVEAAFFLTSIKVTIAASIQMWGPPVGGIAHVDLTVVKFDIDFGTPRPKQPQLIGSWNQFCHDFLSLSGGDQRAVDNPVKAVPLVQPNLTAGRNNLNTLPNARRKDSEPKREDAVWKVRADELELAAAAVVPVTTLNVGTVKTNSPPEGVQDRKFSGQPMMVTKPLTLDSKGLRTQKSANPLGVQPMGKVLDSVLNVTIVRDEATTEAVDLSGWTMKEESGALPAALWDAAAPNLKPSEPSAKLLDGCITGLKRLKPAAGLLGSSATPPAIEWHKLTPGHVSKSTTSQGTPSGTSSRNVQAVVAQKQEAQQQIAAALASAGFSLAWKPVTQSEVRFRELQADPMTGTVAA